VTLGKHENYILQQNKSLAFDDFLSTSQKSDFIWHNSDFITWLCVLFRGVTPSLPWIEKTFENRLIFTKIAQSNLKCLKF
jgi:hypothetical protein